MARAYGLCAFVGLGAGLWLSCAEQPINVPFRSLEPAGAVSFLCVSDRQDHKENPGLPIDFCSSSYSPHDPAVSRNLMALVTQPTRGEVALINISRDTVVDTDPSKPGFNFLPVGAHPVDLVSTPGGTVTFVGSAQANRESIWVLPSRTIIGGAVRLTSFAACALPSAPGQMMVVVQPSPDGDRAQLRCDGNAIEEPMDGRPNGDLAQESGPVGTRKLLVALPDAGAIVVIDAQTLLDREAGSFEACPIEKTFSLQIERPPELPQQPTPEGGWAPGESAEEGQVCTLTERPSVSTTSDFKPRPAGMALDTETNTLWVADEDAPVVHAINVSSPCQMRELPPLLPMSRGRPERDVFTREVAISPTTSSGKKFLYATDWREGSVMVFDISVDSTDRTPLLRPYPDRNPFQQPDRIGFSVPVRDMTFVLRDQPAADPTGAAPVGLQCNPSDPDSVGATYRTAADFTSGAGPRKLRGVFAFLALTNGQIVVIDVDDFDKPCRRPKQAGVCPDEQFSSYDGASGELSCNVVEAHQARGAGYMAASEESITRVPGLQSYPVLTHQNSVLTTDPTEEGRRSPRLLAPVSAGSVLVVGGAQVETIATDPDTAERNMVLFDFEEPRVHIEQDWAVVFEGSIPGFGGHVARLENPDDQGRSLLHDPSAFFCDRGVHDLQAAREAALDLGVAEAEAAGWARSHVDTAQITDDFLHEDDPYWESVAGTCSLQLCREAYGLPAVPKALRDLPVLEAYQDRLLVERATDLMRCCFPTLHTYAVRPQNQWITIGGASGFLHHVTADRSTGRCVDSCDPIRRRLNGRAYEYQGDAPPIAGEPSVFRNLMMQFVIWPGTEPSERDMVFGFRETGSFVPLMVNLAASTAFVQPQAMELVPQIGQLAVADGSTQGLIFIDIGSLSVSRVYF